MTELMKRYWNETGKDAITFSNMATHFTDDYVAWLELQNLLLKLQLTWRPVSEKPEKGQYFLANPSQTDRDLIIDACPRTYQFLGECSWEKFVQSRGIVKWLPIPPMKERE